MNTYATKCFKQLIIGTLFLLFSFAPGYSQTYQVNGSAVDAGNGLIKLTADGAGQQVSTAWNTTKIDLNQPFDMSFDMFFGCNSSDALVGAGGDGITFTFQNASTGLNSIGGDGGNLGLFGISPAVSIEFDTYDGSSFGGSGTNELAADHIALDLNGVVNSSANLFIGSDGLLVSNQAVANGRDLEDCATNSNNFYTIRVTWDPITKQLKLYEEGVLAMTYTNDIVTTIFGGDNMVYWGFTSATGSATNEQWIAPAGSIIPWTCTGNVCCVPFTVTPSSPTTICNNPITLEVADSYSKYDWSTGSTNSTIQINAPGTYTLNVFQDQGGNSCPGTVDFIITATGSTAVLSGDATLCNTAQTTPISVALTGLAPWSLTYAIDGVNQTPVTGITTSPYVIQGSAPHVYTLVSVSDNSGCNSNATGSATVGLVPGIPVGNDDVFTAPGTANLSVDDDGGTYQWYDAATGGSLVFTGDAYTTPVLTGTTTYYVENTAVVGTTQKSVALLNKSEGTGNDVNDHTPGLPAAVCYLEFTANSNFTLDELTCLVNATGATSTGSVTVNITPYVGAAPYTGAETIAGNVTNISVASAGQTNVVVPLNYSCTAGTTYHISYSATNSLQTELYWQLLPVIGGYPITADPELSITQYDLGRPGRYPGLFDWKISVPTAAASCGRTPVTAYTCPVAVLSGDAVICNDGSTTPLSVTLTGRAPWTLTYGIDGIAQTAVTGIGTSPYVFQSTTGAHTYTLVSVLNGDCNGTVSGSAAVTLTAGSPIGHDDVFVASNTADLSVDDGGDMYEWYDSPVAVTPIFTGANFTTPILNATTTYYVKNASIVSTVSKSVALLNKSEGTGNDVNDHTPGLPAAVCYLEFTANSNFTLDELTCLVNATGATSTGSVTVNITPYVGAAPYTGAETIAGNVTNISVASAGQTNVVVPLNYSCTAGTTYHISYSATNSLQTELYWQLLPVIGGYPITADPELSITQYDLGRPGRYPGLFDWKITTISATPACGRTPVTAYICPTASLSGDAVICNDGVKTTPLSVVLTGDQPWTFIYAIDGVNQTSITNITTSPYLFQSLTGAHLYSLSSVSTANSAGCLAGTSGTATVGVKPDAPVGHDGTFIRPSSTTLFVNNTGGIYNWYSTSTGGSKINVGETFTTPVLNNTTTYYVEQVVGSDTSCSRTAVTANAVTPLDPLFIPNLVTPNDDGKNDVFEIKGLPNETALVIFNSWGDRIYSADNYTNNWAATDVSKGVYYYELTFKTGESYKGWVQIL